MRKIIGVILLFIAAIVGMSAASKYLDIAYYSGLSDFQSPSTTIVFGEAIVLTVITLVIVFIGVHLLRRKANKEANNAKG